MFGSNNSKNNKEEQGSPRSSAAPGSHNSLEKGTIIEGNISSETDIRVDGKIKGKLKCAAKLIIGPAGFIEGEVNCQNAIIEGRFQGTLYVAELLNVRESAEIQGDVFTGKLIVQPGAVFNVNCRMGNQQELSHAAKAAKEAASARSIAPKASKGDKPELSKEAG